ncbi:MAG: branched-chain amino acid ABC transporter permease [Nitrospinaceae bacterium]|jgi:branched-chain amino acid transport system permease protein|nr:branched-chain amino acid ABC transporter permease [Nitrospinaceae bacterium]MBT3435135.1 branched-chain amino acid ABC transporter permease [Nitrospinaceae bacterium]MBT3820228.1 branched-chain amino acid ABC transporter permease [Nitrospinaceae bacterium]MBT4094786.1 branched-chain amino acid ABC transporter permease [Nitrospinaceae bacterium]MBT4429525.1 branched-chain amino acid ABC transporter permease [Nitrospinaceae bacterium]
MGSPQERKRIYIVLGVFGTLALITPFLDLFLQSLVTEILIFGLLAMSLDILLGFTGLASLGHAAYFGVASYASAIVMTKKSWVITYAMYTGASEAGLGLLFLFFVGILVAFIFAAFFGFLAIRAKDVYFLMITLSLAMVVWGLAYRWSAVTEGDNGIIINERPTLLGMSIAEGLPFFYFTLVVFLLCLGALYVIVQSPFGRTLVGIREREERMEMLGYNIWLHKYLAFIIAGTFSGVAGVMWTLYNLFVSPPDVELITSAEALFMVALGGPATLVGPVIGAAIIRSLQQFVSIYVERWPLILGSIYIITIMVSRLYGVDGLLGFAKKFRSSSAASEKSES